MTETLLTRLQAAIAHNARALEIVAALEARGFPHAHCRATVQLTQENSRLYRALRRDGPQHTLDVAHVEARGLVLGHRSQRGHKMLYEWDQIVSVH